MSSQPQSHVATLVEDIVAAFISACESTSHMDPTTIEHKLAGNAFLHVYCVAASNLLIQSCLRKNRSVPGTDLLACFVFLIFSLSDSMGKAQEVLMDVATASGEINVESSMIDAAFQSLDDKKDSLKTIFGFLFTNRKKAVREFPGMAVPQQGTVIVLQNQKKFLESVSRWSNLSRKDDIVSAERMAWQMLAGDASIGIPPLLPVQNTDLLVRLASYLDSGKLRRSSDKLMKAEKPGGTASAASSDAAGRNEDSSEDDGYNANNEPDVGIPDPTHPSESVPGRFFSVFSKPKETSQDVQSSPDSGTFVALSQLDAVRICLFGIRCCSCF
jgi:hypothetical protein